MKTLLAIVGIVGVALSQGQVEAQSGKPKSPLDLNAQVQSVNDKPAAAHALKKVAAEDKIKVPVAYLSIEKFYARRDLDVVPPRTRIVGFVQNYNRQTVTGATFSIERWDGSGWTRLKSGTYGPIEPNKQAADSVDIDVSWGATKFRYVVTPSVEGSKQAELPALSGAKTVKGDAAKIKGGLDLSAQVTAIPKDNITWNAVKKPLKGLDLDTEVTQFPQDRVQKTKIEDRIQKTKLEFLNLSIDQFYANRFGGGILIGALMSNKNKQTVPESPYSIYQAKGTGWIRIKSGTLKPVAANGSVFESVTLPANSDAMKFKIEVSLSVQGSAQCSLPQIQAPAVKVFVVQYRTPEWQILAGWSNRTPLEASKRMKGLNNMGFDTKYSYVTNDYLFDSSTHLTVYYRSVGWQERTFPTMDAARAFERSRLIAANEPNREYADILPRAIDSDRSVETKIIER